MPSPSHIITEIIPCYLFFVLSTQNSTAAAETPSVLAGAGTASDSGLLRGGGAMVPPKPTRRVLRRGQGLHHHILCWTLSMQVLRSVSSCGSGARSLKEAGFFQCLVYNQLCQCNTDLCVIQ